ncbi:MAG: hypothetical protein IPF48_14105 [Sphingomonadales bacterium]|nr:hypothetical protein [Sphingomonadales bacterium]
MIELFSRDVVMRCVDPNTPHQHRLAETIHLRADAELITHKGKPAIRRDKEWR